MEINLVKLIPLIDWRSFCIIFESIYFNRAVPNGQDFEVIMVLIIFVLQKEHDLSDFKLEKQSIE